MDYPLSSGEGGINIKPEKMEKEKLYHCIFNDKLILVFKDSQDVLNCYEVEEESLIERVKNSNDDNEVEKVFEDYIKEQNLKN